MKKFENFMNKDDPVYLKINLDTRHPSNQVEVDLWFSTLLDVPYALLEGMHDYHQLLGNDVSFKPRIATYSCPECPSDVKQRDCLSDGKYCPFKPQHN